jgi:hypothetical protein
MTAHCLCGGVRFEITGKIGPVVYCHCSQCRRANGSAFAANADVRTRYVQWTSGREEIREYESSPGKVRAFCSRCGSPLYSRTGADPATIRVRLGVLDGDPGRRSLAHCWVRSKAPWFEISDELPRFDEGPPAAERIYHITTAAALRAHCAGDSYAPPSLAREGFVHCTATRSTLLAVARDYYGDATPPLLVLAIDPARLSAELRFEAPVPIPGGGTAHLASGELFPHLYGPLELSAVVGVGELRREGSAFAWPGAFDALDAWLG